ncbi:MAG: 4Fe-4S single cluster domain-containing protein [Candidatus Nanoarchaeia archaeon]|jgi:anaerobic ribonucleoside-triphosphate reductase activating protein|nr:4Fe-4S single cluster domain-containing protein [Candidatus Nanoarchaeia archaeon]
MNLKLNHIIEKSHVQGPGDRFTIWVQGCSIHCKDCINTDTWDFNAGTSIEIEELASSILKSSSLGLTITGGEPLDQYDSIFALSEMIFGKKSIFLCSGYTFPKIKEKFSKILTTIDMLCSGPFDSEKKCESQWKGSSNQEVIFLTPLGEQQLNLPVYRREYRINKKTGEVLITGFSI